MRTDAPSVLHRLDRYLNRLPVVLLGALLATGCASTLSNPGDALLQSGDYNGAVTELERQAVENPGNAEVVRNLGIALLKSGQPPAAVEKLQEARRLAPDDPTTLYFLGAASEQAGQLDLAIEADTAYLAKTDKHGAVVRARLDRLGREKARTEVQAAIKNEQSLTVASIPENSLAVPDFINVAASDTLAPLSRGLSAVLVTDLSKVSAFRVLERDRLKALLDELGMAQPAPTAPPAPTLLLEPMESVTGLKQRLAALIQPASGKPYYGGAIDEKKNGELAAAVQRFQSDHGLTADGVAGPRTYAALRQAIGEAPPLTQLPVETKSPVDPATAPRLGVLLGARRFVQGSFTPVGGEDLQLNGNIIGVSEGTLSAAGKPVSGPLPRVLYLEKDLLNEVLTALGVAATPQEKEEIERVPTQSFPAFMAYARGLELRELGRDSEALAAFREAARLDPGFQEAEDMAEITSVGPGEIRAVNDGMLQGALQTGETPTDRLIRTGTWLGLGPGPQMDRWASEDPAVSQTEKGSGTAGGGTGEIVIGGNLPGRNQ